MTRDPSVSTSVSVQLLISQLSTHPMSGRELSRGPGSMQSLLSPAGPPACGLLPWGWGGSSKSMTSVGEQKYTVSCQGANDAVGDVEVEAATRLLPAPLPASSHLDGVHSHLGGVAAPAAASVAAAEVEVVVLQLEIPLAPNLAVATAARARGCFVALRASPISAATLPHAHELLDSGAVSHLFVGEFEAPALLESEDGAKYGKIENAAQAIGAASALMAKWPHLVMVSISCSVADLFRYRATHRPAAAASPSAAPPPPWSPYPTATAAPTGQAPPHARPHAHAPAHASRATAFSAANAAADAAADAAARDGMGGASEVAAGEEAGGGSGEVAWPHRFSNWGADAGTALGGWYEEGYHFIVPRPKLKAIDVVGAADAFLGGFVASHPHLPRISPASRLYLGRSVRPTPFSAASSPPAATG